MKKFDLSKYTNTLKIVFDDGDEFRLPDISYGRFLESVLYEDGSSDFAYDNYLRENGMLELSDINEGSTNKITLIDEQPYRGRVLKFRLVYDSLNDPEFDEKEYFGEI